MKLPETTTKRLLLLGAAGMTLYLMLGWFEHRQVFHPSRTFDTTGTDLGRPFEDVYFSAADGTRINGWFFPADTNSARKELAVLVCHGNGGNISHRLTLAKALLSTGVNVFLLEYRGYGRSEGRPSESGTYQDSRAAHDWLRNKGFAAANIIAFGESLGGAVAGELAAGVPTGGLVLQSTFTSIPDIGAELFPWLPVRFMARIRYDTLSRLPRVGAPVLIMHSRTDALIGFDHAQRNFAAANEPKLFAEITGGHNEPFTDREQFIAGIERFLQLVRGR